MRQKLPILVCSAIFCCLFVSCNESNQAYRNIEEYYFPMDSLNEGLVYEYGVVGSDSIAPFFQYYRRIDQDSHVFLVSMQYDAAFVPQFLSREERVENGMLLVDAFRYLTDSNGYQIQLPVEIHQGSAFPFLVRDSGGIFLYNIRIFNQPGDTSAFTRIIKNRRFDGDTTINWKGKNIPAVRFSVKEAVEDFQEGYWEKTFDGVEIYARDIGLVYFKKTISNAMYLEYALKDRFPMEELENRFGRQEVPAQ